MTLVATAKKLDISFYNYVFDRTAEVYALPSLAEIIQQQNPVSCPIGHGSS
jgi:hypothetical protein